MLLAGQNLRRPSLRHIEESIQLVHMLLQLSQSTRYVMFFQYMHRTTLVMMCVQVALKCADVGHLALPTDTHKVWVERLQSEYFLQGDRERENGMAISALMDRRKASKLSSSQVHIPNASCCSL